MLVQFSVKNYKTFKETAVLSLVASNYDKETRERDNIFKNEKYNIRLLKNAVIYGPNASGKTKLFDAVGMLRAFILRSYEGSLKGMPIPVEPFKLNSVSQTEPSEFEIVLLHKNTLYRYGFEANHEKIISEWLYYKPESKETEIFYRTEDQINYNKTAFSKGEFIKKEKALRNNVLLLTLAASLNDTISNLVIDFVKTLKMISGLDDDGCNMFTTKQMEKPEEKINILNFIKYADLGINDINLKNLKVEDIPASLPDGIKDQLIKAIAGNDSGTILPNVITSHKIYDKDNNHVGDQNFTMGKEESAGTEKFFSLSGPILDCLKNGETLIVDELDSKFHPNLVDQIISLFNSAERNPNNAQLIVNTHNTNLLSKKLIRRDQVWFTDKNRYGEAKLYSLADLKSVRKGDAFENNYLMGKYGAVPYLSFEDIVL